MIVIGIDVAKDKHDCQIVDTKGDILVEHFKFENSLKGFNSLLDCIRACTLVAYADIRVGIEYTGHYQTNLVAFLHKKGFRIIQLNPNLVSQYKRYNSLRRTKTDRLDCSAIAQVAMSVKAVDYSINAKTEELKTLSRASYRITRMLIELKNRYRRLLQIAFPELEQLFSPNNTSTIMLMNKYPSPRLVRRDSRDNIIQAFNSFPRANVYKASIDKYIELANNSIGQPNDGDVYEMRLVTSQMIMFNRQKKNLLERVSKIMKGLNSPITTIPGISYLAGATILGEIGDINRFSTPEKLLAYAGCDPRIYESGKHVGFSAPINRCGSKYLRTTLFNAVIRASCISPQFSKLIEIKRSEGKHFFNATFHGIKKMVRIIYKVLKSGKPYVEPN